MSSNVSHRLLDAPEYRGSRAFLILASQVDRSAQPRKGSTSLAPCQEARLREGSDASTIIR